MNESAGYPYRAIDLAEIRWYANAIENAAIQVYATRAANELEELRNALKATYYEIHGLAASWSKSVPGCPWILCPGGGCAPACLPNDGLGAHLGDEMGEH